MRLTGIDVGRGVSHPLVADEAVLNISKEETASPLHISDRIGRFVAGRTIATGLYPQFLPNYHTIICKRDNVRELNFSDLG